MTECCWQNKGGKKNSHKKHWIQTVSIAFLWLFLELKAYLSSFKAV